MARKKKGQEEHVNHERWLVSYADFITLMFAFFVVLFASSQADQDKARQVSEGLERALAEGNIRARVMQMLGTPSAGKADHAAVRDHKPKEKPNDKTGELAPSLKHLSKLFKDEIAKKAIEVNLTPRGLVISLKEAAFFPSGDNSVKPEAYPIVAKVARTIEHLKNPVRLEGHTDAIPIHNARFRSNWDLSSARSIAMLELLHDRFGIPTQRLAVVGYADTIPVDSNGTPEGRARNRRVDITVLNELAALNEAKAAPEHRGH